MTVENTQTSDEGQGPDKSDDSIGLEDLQNLEFHPLANVFPLLEGDELQELADDIKKNRLHDHITLYEGKILDGRNRYNALKLAGSEIARFLFDDFIDDDGDPIEFVISKNIRRRHLTADQRSVIAAELYAKLPKEKFGGDRKSFSAITENEKLPSADSQKQKVATKMEVSVTQLERAAAIRNKDPEKASQVKAGTKKLVDAEKELKPQKPSNSVKDLPPANKTRQQFKEPEVEETTTITTTDGRTLELGRSDQESTLTPDIFLRFIDLKLTNDEQAFAFGSDSFEDPGFATKPVRKEVIDFICYRQAYTWAARDLTNVIETYLDQLVEQDHVESLRGILDALTQYAERKKCFYIDEVYERIAEYDERITK